MLCRCKTLRFLGSFEILSPLSSLVFSKPTVSAAKLAEDEFASSPIPRDPVREILLGLRSSGFRRFLIGDYFRNLASNLNQSQVDLIVDDLSAENSDFAVFFFDLMREEYKFRHSAVSRFVVSHVFASQRRFKELRFVLEQMVKDEDFG